MVFQFGQTGVQLQMIYYSVISTENMTTIRKELITRLGYTGF